MGHSLSGLAALQLRKQQLEAQQQYNAVRLKQDAMLDAAHATLYRSQAEREGAQTADITERTGARSEMANVVRKYLGDQAFANGPTAQGAEMLSYLPVAHAAARVAGQSPARIGTQVPQILQSYDPRFRERLALGGRPEVNVPMGSTLYDPLANKPLFEANVNLAPGHVLRSNEPGQAGVPQQRTSGTTVSPNTALNLLGNENSIDSLTERLGPGIVDFLSRAATNSPSSMLSAPVSNEVERVTKDGRRAIFEATTKKFLRYAN